MSRRVTGWRLALVGVCGCKLVDHVVTFAALAQLALPFWLPPRRAALSDLLRCIFTARLQVCCCIKTILRYAARAPTCKRIGRNCLPPTV